jgi:hypothetical protein
MLLVAGKDILDDLNDQVVDASTVRRVERMRDTIAYLDSLVGTMRGSERARNSFDEALGMMIERYINSKFRFQAGMEAELLRLLALPLDRPEPTPVVLMPYKHWWQRLLGL